MRATIVVGMAAVVLVAAAPAKWAPEFKAAIQTRLTFAFVQLERGDELAECMTEEFEARLSQEGMVGFDSTSPEHTALWNRTIRLCACKKLKIAKALAEPGFCPRKDTTDI